MPSKATPRQRAPKGMRPMPEPRVRRNRLGQITSYQVWSAPFKVDGKWDRKPLGAKTPEQLREKYERFYRDHCIGDTSALSTGEETVLSFGSWWLEDIVKPKKITTWNLYKGYFERNVCHPEYGIANLILGYTGKADRQYNLENLAAWARRMQKAGVPLSVIRGSITVMRSMNDAMVENQARSGVKLDIAQAVRFPKGSHKTRRSKARKKSDPQITLKLMLACEEVLPPHLRALWLVITGLGLRRGEVAGLQWDDFDLRFDDQGRYLGGTVTINRQISVSGKYVQIAPPKDRNWDFDDPEVLNIKDAALARALLAQKTAQKALRFSMGRSWGHPSHDKSGRRLRGEWVFCEDGLFMHPTRFNTIFEKVCEHAGVDAKTLHDGRHDHASLAVFLGATREEVRVSMRHRNLSTTDEYFDPVVHDNPVSGLVGDYLQKLRESVA